MGAARMRSYDSPLELLSSFKSRLLSFLCVTEEGGPWGLLGPLYLLWFCLRAGWSQPLWEQSEAISCTPPLNTLHGLCPLKG